MSRRETILLVSLVVAFLGVMWQLNAEEQPGQCTVSGGETLLGQL